MQPITRQTVFERRHSSVRWSAVLAGATVAIGLWIFLQVLGMGLGLSSIDTDDAGSIRNAGMGAGIWSLIAPILALFAGGVVAARTSQTYDRTTNGIHAVMMWAIATVLGVLAMVWMITTLAGAAVTTGRAAAEGAGKVAGGAAQLADGAVDRGAFGALGVDADDLLGPVNARLRQEGKPEVTAAQLGAAGRDVIDRSLREGKLDRAMMIDRLDARTELDRAEATEVAQAIEQRLGTARERLGDAGDRVERAALTAADRTGKAMVWASLAMLLSLGAAIGGAMLGAMWRRRDRDGGGIEGRREQPTQEMWATRDTGTAPMGSGTVQP